MATTDTQVPVAINEASTIKALQAKVAELEANSINKAKEVGKKEWSIKVAEVAIAFYGIAFVLTTLAVFNILNFGPIFSVPIFAILFLGSLYFYLTSSFEDKS